MATSRNRRYHRAKENYSKSYNAQVTLDSEIEEPILKRNEAYLEDWLSDEEMLEDIEKGGVSLEQNSLEQADTEAKAGKQEVRSVDSVSSVSIHNQARKKHEVRKDLAAMYENAPVEKLLLDYHCGNKDKDTRKWLRDEVFFRTYFLIPHSIKESYPIASHIFNDAMQNMSFAMLQAIEKFDPTKGYTFVNYLAGYFKGAIARTFRDTNVISVPTGRRKLLKERQKYIRTESFSSSDEIRTYNGVEYTENGSIGMLEIDFDEDLHNKQLIEWLEEALSAEAQVVTSDERRVLVLRYGLFGHPKEPYRDIAKLRQQDGLGCAFSRLSQIHAKSVGKLKKYFEDRDIDEY